ncbi:hypothetical protein AVEN_107863-1, partial [Araneus ventricosus]
MEDSDSEYETEETVVLVELNGIIDADLLLQQQTLTKILGIDTDEPLLQIGNCLFKGEYDDTLGTVVLYEPVDGSQKDGLESNDSDFKFLCKTDTKLTMKRCFLQERSMDNLKSAEVSPPVAIQNEEPKKSVTVSKMKKAIKKKIVSKKKKITKPMPKKLVKSKKNTKNDQMNSVEKQNKEITSKSETSEQLIENMAESIEDNSLSRSDAISSEVLNLQKVEEKSDQSKPAYSESLELQDDKKKTEVSKKRRKRNRDEANDDPINPGENIEDFTRKKLMKVEEAEVHMADKETITLDKEKGELDKSDSQKNVILSGIEAFVSETERRDEQMVEEGNVIEALVSTVIRNECEMEEKGTTAFASETNKGKIITEESIAKTLEKKVTNDASETSASDMVGKKMTVIEESVPTVLGNTVINNESEIQVKSTVVNISEIEKESVIEEERIIEPVDNTVEANENLVIEEGVPKTMENIVVNIEGEIQQKRAPVSALEVDKNEEFVVEEESVAQALDDTINNVENLIHEGSTPLNISDDDTCGSLATKTDGIDLVLKHGVVKDIDNCSSSSDMEHTRNKGTSEQAGVCESSDDAVNLHPGTEILDKIDYNNASPSCQENNESIVSEKNLVEESNVDDTELSIASDNFAGNSEEKDAIYVVSQSANVDDDTTRKLDEIEGHCSSGNSADELVLNTMDNLNPVGASDMSTPSICEGNWTSSAKKHSSCEVTQSTNSEGEYLENKDLVSEFEAFSELQQNDNLGKNVTIEVDGQFQTTEVEYSEPFLKSNSTASEISQSCQESKFSEENLPVEFEADGAICSQSTDQPVISTEISTEDRDLCVSSCDIDDKAEDKENTEKEVYFNSGEGADLSICEESEIIVICEVSQSDESEKNIPVLSESSENEPKMLSNEYDESFSNTEENLNNAITNQHICEITGGIQKAANVPSTSSIHEVTKSFSIKEVKLSDLPPEKNISNECNKNESNHAPTELSDDKLEYDCVSSLDVPAVSETLLEIEADSEEKDPNSEVSQSFRPAENQQFDATYEASHSKAIEEIKIEETATEFKHPSEVSQSVELESSTSLYNQQNINECDRTQPSSDSLKSFSNYSVEYQGEICESSDDASNIGSNSHVEEVQAVKYSMCEVSQSFRSEETVLTTRHSTDSEMESSNECEVYATSVEPEAEINKLSASERNICESSDDVNEFESEIVIDQLSEREKNICESSDDVNETESEIIVDQLNEREKNICESSDDVSGTESEIIIDQI